jgi:hypothetical protein
MFVAGELIRLIKGFVRGQRRFSSSRGFHYSIEDLQQTDPDAALRFSTDHSIFTVQQIGRVNPTETSVRSDDENRAISPVTTPRTGGGFRLNITD